MSKLIEKIKSNGYWRIIIRPTEFIEKRINSREECSKLIQESQLRLRGWPYPCIDRHGNGIFFSGNDNVSSSCDWEDGGIFEFWKFYQNGQFVHYLGMIEDYRLTDEEKERAGKSLGIADTKNIHFLSIVNALYLVTEIFYFASELAKKSVLGEEINIEIELGNVYKRTLFFWGGMRFLFRPHVCMFDNENIIKKVVVKKENLISDFANMALDTTIEILKDFGWLDVNREIFTEDQKKLLERRL